MLSCIVRRQSGCIELLCLSYLTKVNQFQQFFRKGLGTYVNLRTTFHSQMDGQAEHTTQTLNDMLRACIMYYKGSWVDHLSLIKFSYNNSYHSRIQMALLEALYGRRFRSPIGWYEVGETRLMLFTKKQICLRLLEKDLIPLKVTKNSFVDVRRRELEIEIGDWVLLKVSTMK